MPETSRTAFEKYQFWFFTFVVGLLTTVIMNGLGDSRKLNQEMQKEIGFCRIKNAPLLKSIIY